MAPAYRRWRAGPHALPAAPPLAYCRRVATGNGDTYWSQYTNQTTDAAGMVVDAGDTAPSNDRRNLVAIELLSDD
jgi:hypothetical protein